MSENINLKSKDLEVIANIVIEGRKKRRLPSLKKNRKKVMYSFAEL